MSFNVLVKQAETLYENMEKDFIKDVENILKETFKEPPCKDCKYFKPTYNKLLILCQSNNMEKDFSCFEEKKEEKELLSQILDTHNIKIIYVDELPNEPTSDLYELPNGKLYVYHEDKYKELVIEKQAS